MAQGEFPPDLTILKTTAQYNDVIAGMRLSVIEEATVSQSGSV
ncbi:MAG: hypothetical protein AAF298_13115 [Cyanobacteria bacterium P01_A01_bin.40]